MDKEQKARSVMPRVRLTARLTLPAYDALAEIQRLYRRETGRAKPAWRIIDEAIRYYAKREGIQIRE